MLNAGAKKKKTPSLYFPTIGTDERVEYDCEQLFVAQCDALIPPSLAVVGLTP